MIKYICCECKGELIPSLFEPGKSILCFHTYLVLSNNQIDFADFRFRRNGMDFIIVVNFEKNNSKMYIDYNLIIKIPYVLPLPIDDDGTVRFDLVVKRMQSLVAFS